MKNVITRLPRSVRPALICVGWAITVGSASAQTTLYGPTPYLCVNDSPFVGLGLGYFHLENFEDHLFNTPGVSANSGSVTSATYGVGAAIIDSVDCDDGAINGTGMPGDSFFASPDITFTFNAAVLGTLPTHAGLVWTDGGPSATVIFEAFDAHGMLLGTVTDVCGDFTYFGTTAEDRFFGISSPGGVSSIRIRHNAGGLEIDHLQYGGSGCRADFTGDGFVTGDDFDAYVIEFIEGNPSADFDADGFVTGDDFDAFVTAFEAGC